MYRRNLIIFPLIVLLISPPSQARLTEELHSKSFKTASPFSIALEALEKLIGYTFEHNDLLWRAMTHSSYSEENNKALSVLGESVIETSVALRLLRKDIDTSASDLNRRLKETANVESSCAADAMHLGLQKVVRVSSNTNSSTPTVVCSAFRAIFGAIALDANNSEAAGIIFWDVHHGEIGKALPL